VNGNGNGNGFGVSVVAMAIRHGRPSRCGFWAMATNTFSQLMRQFKCSNNQKNNNSNSNEQKQTKYLC